MSKLKRNVRKTWEDSTEPVTCQFQNQGWKEAGNTLYETKIYKCSHSSSCHAERSPRAKAQLPLESRALQASWPATLCCLIRRWGVSWNFIFWNFSRVGARIQDWWNCLASQHPSQDKTKKNLSQQLPGNEAPFHMLYVRTLSRNGFRVTFHESVVTVGHKVNFLMLRT